MASEQWKKDNQDKMREYRRRWYAKNKEKSIEKVALRKQEMKAWYKEYKSTLSCVKCSENHPATLHFHHLDKSTKETNLANALSKGWSKTRILNEIDKCIVLCANCHSKEHWEDLY